MSYDDETLMAYADGELDEQLRAEITAASEKDPELARRIEHHRALRAEIAGAYSGLLDQPMPERLRAAARGARAQNPGGNVVPFPARNTRPPRTPWGAREWIAMAASLVLGVMLSWRLLPPDGEIATKLDALVARGELTMALDTQLASDQSPEAPVRIGISFKNQDGAYCRSFVSRATSTAGFACRQGDTWHIVQTNSITLPGGDLQQAAASLPSSLLQGIEARISGEPLDAAEEVAAREAGWVSGAPR